jgi:hypothetical protein
MNAGGRALVILAALAILLSSCATVPQKPAQQSTQQPSKEPEKPPQQQPDKPPVGDVPKTGEGFVATAELYEKTFNEVEQVIAALTRIISDKDYDTWTTYLTKDYVRVTGSSEFLADASGSSVLKKNGIVLKSLKDYFDNVVVRSRIEATLDDITFVDATHVKAIAKFKGTPVILYYLVREDERWKVGIIEHAQN